MMPKINKIIPKINDWSMKMTSEVIMEKIGEVVCSAVDSRWSLIIISITLFMLFLLIIKKLAGISILYVKEDI